MYAYMITVLAAIKKERKKKEERREKGKI